MQEKKLVNGAYRPNIPVSIAQTVFLYSVYAYKATDTETTLHTIQHSIYTYSHVISTLQNMWHHH